MSIELYIVLYLMSFVIIGYAAIKLLVFIERRFWMILCSTVALSGMVWLVRSEPLGHINPEYYIAIPFLGAMGVGALLWLSELLWKLERLWDRALEARRYRKLQATPPWGPRAPEE